MVVHLISPDGKLRRAVPRATTRACTCKRRARAHAGRRRRARLRRRRLRDARLAGSGQDRGARPDRRRRRARDPRAERPGLRRQLGAPADAERQPSSCSRSTRRAGSRTDGRVRRNRRQERRRDGEITRLGGRRAHRARRRATTRCVRCSTTRTRSAIGIFQAPGANALELSTHVRARWRSSTSDFPAGRALGRSSTTPRSSCATRSTRSSRRCSRRLRWWCSS